MLKYIKNYFEILKNLKSDQSYSKVSLMAGTHSSEKQYAPLVGKII
jgi:hypothetical protein